MSEPIEPFLQLLQLEAQSDAVFVGAASHEPHVRAFGGLVAAQAISAANQTVDGDRPANSLHAYFLRPGNPSKPIRYEVETVRNGRSFSTRKVNAIQNDKIIFMLTASFHVHEDGLIHSAIAPVVPSPDTLASFADRFNNNKARMQKWFVRTAPFDIRYVDQSPFDFSQRGSPAKQQVWFKTKESAPDSQAIHHAIFTYISDMTILDPILLHHGIKWTDEKVLGASLDHAIWFHQPFRVDEWLLFDQASPITHGARGLAQASVWTADGRLVATVTQEALLRPPHHGSSPLG